MSIGIYSYTNKINGKMYIGQSKNIEQRKLDHNKRMFNNFPSNSEYNSTIHQAIRKYGLQNFDFEIIEECEISKLDEKEIYWIGHYNTYYNGYNQTKGGQNTPIFQKINEEILEEITTLLKQSVLNNIQIAELYGLNDQTISDINVGKMWVREMKYPIREKRQKEIKEKKTICPICSGKKSYGSDMCQICQHKKQKRAERPDVLTLAKMITETGFKQVGEIYGVSDNAIKKWCKSYGIPHLKEELKKWYEKNK